jgi:hypothetical protein
VPAVPLFDPGPPPDEQAIAARHASPTGQSEAQPRRARVITLRVPGH